MELLKDSFHWAYYVPFSRYHTTGAIFEAEIITAPVYAEDFEYHWDVRDHLGNLRMTYKDTDGNGSITQSEILQEQSYYPFGLKHEITQKTALKNSYEFNSMEYINDFGLGLHHTSFRLHDPTIGRFLSVDPRSESLYGLSTYQHGNLSPTMYTDPEGDLPWLAIGIAAAVQGIGGGISSANNGGSFIGGFAKGAAIGGATSIATAGIGGAFGAVGGFGNELGRAAAHGVIGGLASSANGGSFGSGFLGSAVSSGFGSAFNGVSGLGAYVGGGLSGGVTSALSGGNFFVGAGQGIAVTALNHQSHCPDCPTASGPEAVITASRTNYVGTGASLASIGGAVSSSIGYGLANNGNYRGASGNYYSVRSQGFNQYTGTRAHMNSTLSSKVTATRVTRGLGVLNYGAATYQMANGTITGTQWGIEMTSNTISTFAPPIISVPWTVGYEGIGRWGIGRTAIYRNTIRPWVSREVWGN